MGRGDYKNYVKSCLFRNEDYEVPFRTLNDVALNSVDDNRKYIIKLDMLPGKHIANSLDVFLSIDVFTFIFENFSSWLELRV